MGETLSAHRCFPTYKAEIDCWPRILAAYSGYRTSQLTFWHDDPGINQRAFSGKLGEYFQDFSKKANYSGPYDPEGIPILDYRGSIGVQYNPIAVAQYGLGNDNLYKLTGEEKRRQSFLRASDWLVKELEPNAHKVAVWQHKFNWDTPPILCLNCVPSWSRQ